MVSQILVRKKDGEVLKTILEYAEEHGLATGVLSNMTITDATPGACYAHSNDRGATGQIFAQILTPRFGDGIDVGGSIVMTGGEGLVKLDRTEDEKLLLQAVPQAGKTKATTDTIAARYQALSTMGWVTILGMGFCLIASLTLLPTLLILWKRRSSEP